MRVYLAILDETEEARAALRFAARRAAKTGGVVHILALVPRQPFVAFAGVQATIEEEARARAEAQAAVAASSVLTEGGFPPHIEVREGEGIKVVREYLAAHAEVAALVLGSARDGAPGPLVTHFSSHGIGDLPCPLMIVPGGLAEADIDRLS